MPPVLGSHYDFVSFYFFQKRCQLNTEQHRTTSTEQLHAVKDVQ